MSALVSPDPASSYGYVNGKEVVSIKCSTHKAMCPFHSPGKVYTLGPGDSVGNFETHLRNRRHLENVAQRPNL